MQLDRLVLGVDGRKVEWWHPLGTETDVTVGQIFRRCIVDLRRLRRIDELRGFLAGVRALGKRPLSLMPSAKSGLTSVYFSLQCLTQ